MQFISQLRAFEVVSSGLSMQAQIMYYKLFMRSNYYGLGRPFFITNEALMDATKIRSKDTFTNARNQLIQGGLIEYKPGKKGRASEYRLKSQDEFLGECYFNEDENMSPNKGQKRGESGAKPGTKAGGKRGKSGAKPGNQYSLAIDKDKAEAEAGGGAIEYYERNFNPIQSIAEKDDVLDMIETYGDEWVMRAIDEGVKSGARTRKYISAILSRWQKSEQEKPWDKCTTRSDNDNPFLAYAEQMGDDDDEG